MSKLECQYCGIKYNRGDRLNSHLKSRTLKCKETEVFIESKVEERLVSEMKVLKKKIQTRMLMKNNELRKEIAELKQESSQLRSELNKSLLTNTQENKTLSSDRTTFPPKPQGLCVVPVGKEDYDNFLQMDDVQSNLGLGVNGDIELFRKIYIEDVLPINHSIRLRDYSRKKFIIYDGNKWRHCHLRNIINIFIPKIRSMYDRVIAKKKNNRRSIIDKYKNDKEQLDVEIMLFDERYKDKTTHWGKLNVRDQQHIRKVGVGIIDLFSRYEQKDYDAALPNND